jgi:hypothetical protein
MRIYCGEGISFLKVVQLSRGCEVTKKGHTRLQSAYLALMGITQRSNSYHLNNP